MTHTQIRFPLSALFLAVATLAGCGGDSNSPPAPGVAKSAQTITFSQPPAVTVGGGTSTLAATSSSSLVVAFASTTPSICTVSGTTLTPVAAGACHVDASQAGDATYDAATTVGRDITVNAAAPVVASGNTGTCTAAPCVNFAAVGVGLDAFGSQPPVGTGDVLGSVADDPVDATNKVGKLVKQMGANTWGGATIYTTLADKSVAPIDLTTTKIITLRVYSPAAGQLIMLKVENAADTNKNMEAQATTTVANAWETLTFNYTTPTGGAAFNSATVYNKVSVFPMFLLPLSADSTYYFDELKYTAPSAPVTPPVSTLTYSSGFLAASTVELGGYGGYSGSDLDGYYCAPNPANCNGGGAVSPAVAAADSYFYYYNQTTAAKAGEYVGTFVYAPGVTALDPAVDTAGLQIGSQTTMSFTFGENGEWFGGSNNKFVVMLTLGKFYAGQCHIKLAAVVTPTAAAASTYTIPLSSMSVTQNCGVGSLTPSSVAAALALSPVSQIDFQGDGGASALTVNGLTSGSNLTVPAGAVIPTTVVVKGAITFQ